MEIDASLQKDGRKTWMLRDIFLKCGIIDRDGNIYEGPDSDTRIYKYCYGTEVAAIERGLERQDKKKPEPKGTKIVPQSPFFTRQSCSCKAEKRKSKKCRKPFNLLLANKLHQSIQFGLPNSILLPFVGMKLPLVNGLKNCSNEQ